jgi:hypothetical protein
MTLKQYTFITNLRIAIMIVSVAVLIFFAGAIFSGFKPTLSTYVIIAQAVLSLVYAIFNHPVLPPTQNP